MLFWILCLGTALSAPADEFRDFINEGAFIAELSLQDENYLMHIIPSGYSPQKLQKSHKIQLSDIVGKDSDHYKLFMNYVDKGVTMKGLTFNIYDDSMRETAIALFHLLQDIKDEDFIKVKEWATNNINNDIFEYAWRLVALYNNKFGAKEVEPPFVIKPNYFVNGETIRKASKLRIENGVYNYQDAKVNQYYRTDNVVMINTNYSGWNLLRGGCHEKLNYFTEDVSLNSYYYGIHLLHPFWMSNDDLDEINPRHAEHYYFAHQQLMARYRLERQHIQDNTDCENDYNPYLVYDNGLPFPTRSNIKENWTTDRAQIKLKDIAIKECIARGLIFMENGTTIRMTEDNYIDLLVKIIRANFDSIKTANVVRSVFGYGQNKYPIDNYNPAPSVLHHPETSLRDPAYWHMIQNLLSYFTQYKNSLEPYDISKYETDELKLVNYNFGDFVTHFDHYQFNINKALEDRSNNKASPSVITARQKRLKHLPVELNFTVEAKNEKDIIVRLFLGPRCYYEECSQIYSEFYQIDTYRYHLKAGVNELSWLSKKSSRLSFDPLYMEATMPKESKYNMYKFPENLLLPQGVKGGLNMTLFVMLTSIDDSSQLNFFLDNSYNKHISFEVDNKPLGFPFHRQATGFRETASNYKFYNICISHNKWPVEGGYFSPHLY